MKTEEYMHHYKKAGLILIKKRLNDSYKIERVRDILKISKTQESFEDSFITLINSYSELKDLSLEEIKEKAQELYEKKNQLNKEIKIKFDYEKIKPENPIKELIQLKEIITRNFPTLWFETKTILSTVVTLSLKHLNGCPALILVGNPSGEKTTVCSFFYGQEKVYISDDFTPRAFVSHSANITAKDLEKVDLLPKIKNRVLMSPELAPLFEASKEKLLDGFSILTRVLDGEGLNRDSGVHGHRGYTGDYKFVWIGATTPLRSAVWNLMGKIGNRLFFLNMKDKNRTDEDYLQMFSGKSYEERCAECRGAIKSYLDNFFEKNELRTVEWNQDGDALLLREIIKYAKLMTKLRGSIMNWNREEGGKSGTSFPIIEEPPRAINALYNFAKGHALIHERQFLKTEDLEIVKAICFSTMPHDRNEFLKLLAKNEGKLTTKQLEERFSCSQDTALRIMKGFQTLKIVKIKKINVDDKVGRPLKYVEINDEFKDLMKYTQGRNSAINNKSH
jgi:hypothetical protein